MDNNKRYVTQLTANDLREIAAVANVQVGDGIEINRNSQGIVIGIDKQQLRAWVKQIILGRDI